MGSIAIKNNQSIPVKSIPEISADAFTGVIHDLLSAGDHRHCVNYFGVPDDQAMKLYCCVADDNAHDIHISCTRISPGNSLRSLTPEFNSLEKFEREIHENFGIPFTGHPWMKPVRYPFNRFDPSQTIATYPFFAIDSEELHEVGVGPIHAGIIEPGHFRFICNGEKILHLEIQLGFQHRGVEKLFLEKKRLIERITLAESIAGDTVAGHSVTFAALMESLSGIEAGPELRKARTLALELERIAIHTGDLSALCTDIAYQLGSAVFSRLRTPIVNFMQEWCGNRLGKGLIRPGKMNYPFSPELADRLAEVLDLYEPDFLEMYTEMSQLPSALSRFERTGIVSTADTLKVGAVGMAARMAGVNRDIRSSHPNLYFTELNHEPVIKHHGDVYSRVQVRKEEIVQSIGYIRRLLKTDVPGNSSRPGEIRTGKDLFAISLTEGWRGEICHCAITDASGELKMHKVKDPSFHNWLMLALSVRNNEISDFPVCNKSFNLSYCGHDL